MINEKMKLKWYLLYVIKMTLYTYSTCQNVVCPCPFDTLLPLEFKQNWAMPIPKKALRGQLDYSRRRSYRPLLDSLFSYYVVPDTFPGEYQNRDGVLSDIKNKKISKKCVVAYFGKPDKRQKNRKEGNEYWTYYFLASYSNKRHKNLLNSEFFIFVFQKHSEFAFKTYSGYSGE